MRILENDVEQDAEGGASMNQAFKDGHDGKDRVFFFDTTLRDGEQSPGCSMTTPEKLRMAHALEALGVDIIEAGFAIASPGDFAAINSICREVRGPRIASLARARSEDIQAAARSLEGADRSRIHIFLASSDIHLEHKLKIRLPKTRADRILSFFAAWSPWPSMPGHR
jgi:isopropylmalate/homocitrate/citramalate synthase